MTDLRKYYYYDRNKDGHIEATYCFVTDGQVYARGAALRANTDNPCKATGRKIAMSRALNAFYRKRVIQGVTPDGERVFWKENFMPRLRPLEVKFMSSR